MNDYDIPTIVRKVKNLESENAKLKTQLDKTTALYGCACERAEMLEKARDGWAEKYEVQQAELTKLYKLLRATHCRFHEAIVDLERNGYAISQDSTN